MRDGLLTLAVLLPLAACGQGDSGLPQNALRLLASPHGFPFVAALAEEFNRTFPEKQRVIVESVPVVAAWKGLTDGDADAVIQVAEPPADYWSAQLGWAGVAVVVNSQNELTGINEDTVKAVFVGALRQWGELRAAGGSLQPYVPDGDSDLHSRLSALLLEGGSFAAQAVSAPAPWALEEAVRGDPAGIGLILCAGPLEGVSVLRVNGEWPAYEPVFQGRYPLRVPVLATTTGKPNGDLADFIGWAQTLSGQTVLVNLCKVGGS